MKTIAILQSNYIPWKGYFDLIAQVDEFIFHDDLQFTKNDWRNRNRIKTDEGPTWLTIPCGTNEKRLINEVYLIDHSWQRKHYNLIRAHYGKSTYFNQLNPFLEEIYLSKNWTSLSELNQYIIRTICQDFLGIETKITNSTEYEPIGVKSERVLSLCRKAEATVYVSGPSAQDYLKIEDFVEAGITIQWMDYSGYKAYRQLHGSFIHEVSILDLLLNEGPNARNYLIN